MEFSMSINGLIATLFTVMGICANTALAIWIINISMETSF